MGVVAKKRTENDLCNYKIFSIMFINELVPLFGVLLLFGGIPAIILTGVIMALKTAVTEWRSTVNSSLR